MSKGTTSQYRIWLKINKYFFGIQDLFICAIYFPPVSSNYFEDDSDLLEAEISYFAAQEKILLIGRF